jgi:hypothetical protein
MPKKLKPVSLNDFHKLVKNNTNTKIQTNKWHNNNVIECFDPTIKKINKKIIKNTDHIYNFLQKLALWAERQMECLYNVYLNSYYMYKCILFDTDILYVKNNQLKKKLNKSYINILFNLKEYTLYLKKFIDDRNISDYLTITKINDTSVKKNNFGIIKNNYEILTINNTNDNYLLMDNSRLFSTINNKNIKPLNEKKQTPDMINKFSQYKQKRYYSDLNGDVLFIYVHNYIYKCDNCYKYMYKTNECKCIFNIIYSFENLDELIMYNGETVYYRMYDYFNNLNSYSTLFNVCNNIIKEDRMKKLHKNENENENIFKHKATTKIKLSSVQLYKCIYSFFDLLVNDNNTYVISYDEDSLSLNIKYICVYYILRKINLSKDIIDNIMALLLC